MTLLGERWYEVVVHEEPPGEVVVCYWVAGRQV